MTGGSRDPSSQLLSGKHAVVTGGARGIGAAVTEMLLALGAHVTSVSRTLTATPNQTLAAARDAFDHVSADVSDTESVTKAFELAHKHFGEVAILVNNAGQAASAPFVKTDAALWRRMMAVNLDGTFHCTQAALPGMLAAGWGRIVNIASMAGLIGYGDGVLRGKARRGRSDASAGGRGSDERRDGECGMPWLY